MARWLALNSLLHPYTQNLFESMLDEEEQESQYIMGIKERKYIRLDILPRQTSGVVKVI